LYDPSRTEEVRAALDKLLDLLAEKVAQRLLRDVPNDDLQGQNLEIKNEIVDP
jgi:hypothetical protein